MAKLLLLGAACLFARAAGAQEATPTDSCRVELVNAPSLTWRQAEAWLPAASNPAARCRELYVRVDEQGADVTIVERDGRQAQRRVARPEELTALLEARSMPPAPARPPPGRSAAPEAPAWSVLGSALTGARAGAAALLSPALAATLMARFRSWEFGGGLGWEARYYDLFSSTSRGTDAFVPALAFARRQPLRQTALIMGARVGLGVVRTTQVEAEPSSGALDLAAFTRSPHTDYELRPGTFVGVSWPRHGWARLRAELGFDFVAWDSFVLSAPANSFGGAGFVFRPNYTPDWAISLMLGAEFGRL
ncbi:MAG TPA: hypothetical protein VFZ61_08605 [Polyangiales bacterium]